ncbi:unnamed protein product [Cuscuta campestris]|uniref:Uncharacterized protein n=1 Tax=Cuscuta campestris TaxID=132261 RepID=A0A484MUS1_9ASTE|nr:unnamed protein product [Cuscuta campestris]
MESHDFLYDSCIPETEFQDGGGEDCEVIGETFISDAKEEDEAIVIHNDDVMPMLPKMVIDLEAEEDCVILIGSDEDGSYDADTNSDDMEGSETIENQISP